MLWVYCSSYNKLLASLWTNTLPSRQCKKDAFLWWRKGLGPMKVRVRPLQWLRAKDGRRRRVWFVRLFFNYPLFSSTYKE